MNPHARISRPRRSIWKIVALLSALLLFAVSCGVGEGGEAGQEQSPATATEQAGDEQETNEPIVIGILADQTGSASYYSDLTLNGVQLAVDEINEAGGINGRQIELVMEDDENDPSQSAANAKKLADDPSVVAVLSTTSSGATLQNQQVTEEEGLPNIAPTNVNDELTAEPLEYFFAYVPKDSEWVAHLLELTAERHEALGIVVDNSQTGLSVRDSWVEELESLGQPPAATEAVEEGTSDATPVINRLRDAGVDAVLVGGHSVPDISVFMRDKKAVGWDVPTYGTWLFAIPSLLELGGEALNGLIFVDIVDDNAAKVQEFADKLTEAYGGDFPLNAFSGAGYDSMNVLAAAIEQGGAERDAIQGALEDLSYNEPVMGAEGCTIEFGSEVHQGMSTDCILLRQIQNQQYGPYEEGS